MKAQFTFFKSIVVFQLTLRLLVSLSVIWLIRGSVISIYYRASLATYTAMYIILDLYVRLLSHRPGVKNGETLYQLGVDTNLSQITRF